MRASSYDIMISICYYDTEKKRMEKFVYFYYVTNANPLGIKFPILCICVWLLDAK